VTSLPETSGTPNPIDVVAGVFAFDHDHGMPARELVELLGGKGAGLAEMTTELGINVPPGFTVGVPVCRAFRANGWPEALDAVLDDHVARLGARMGRRLGDAADPLLVAVRSGGPVSMPGMLDTVLNLGLNDDTVLGLAERSGAPWFAWDSYRRFVSMYAVTVMGLDPTAIDLPAPGDSADDVRDHVRLLLDRVSEVAGRPVPSDPRVQLQEAVEAVFRSWDCARAQTYRTKEGIDHALGTAVNVQAMVFGNRGPRSGTGVVFTRDPATGALGPYGDYLPRAQGEEVVSGSVTTMPITHLGDHLPDAYDELVEVLRRLEVHYRDLCDVEFTLEEGRLWLLQTRVGKRGAVAAVRIAADLLDDPEIRLTPEEARVRVPPSVRERARQEVLSRVDEGGSDEQLLGTGLGASPGRVQGRVVFSSDEAGDATDDVILVRKETSPEDVAGMAASVGILTTRGGLVSHAAVVARGWGLPAVVGADQLTLTGDAIVSAGGLRAMAGDVITIDGTSGRVWLGEVDAPLVDTERLVADELPELLRLEQLGALAAVDVAGGSA
jgi:pyruvate,orthophosphate dikinase